MIVSILIILVVAFLEGEIKDQTKQNHKHNTFFVFAGTSDSSSTVTASRLSSLLLFHYLDDISSVMSFPRHEKHIQFRRRQSPSSSWRRVLVTTSPKQQQQQQRTRWIASMRNTDRTRRTAVIPAMNAFGDDDNARTDSFLSPSSTRTKTSIAAFSFLTIGFLYWYLLVLGAYVSSIGLPGIPDWLPMSPGWPPSDADLAPAIEDSIHFFYISDLLDATTTGSSSSMSVSPPPPTLRLALFNIAEAWIFAMLPALFVDERRLPLPIVVMAWTGALGLTNAFLAPYLAIREFYTLMQASSPLPSISSSSSSSMDFADTMTMTSQQRDTNNVLLPILMGAIALVVIVVAIIQTWNTLVIVDPQQRTQELSEFMYLVATDRTYLAFCIDLVLFSIFQIHILESISQQQQQRQKKQNSAGAVATTAGEEHHVWSTLPILYKIPLLGLIAWLLSRGVQE